MAILQAARAHLLGMDLEHSYSWGLNRAIFYAAAKRGFAPRVGGEPRRGWGGGGKPVGVPATRTYTFGTETALVGAQGYFQIGDEPQTPEDFARQIASRVKDFRTAWSEAMWFVQGFPTEVLESQGRFFKEVYEPNRDALAAKWV